MKKLLHSLLMTLVCAVCVQAQDVITKRNGEDIQAKILEVNQTEIKYKRFDNPEGPTFVIPKSEILIIRYENGTNEVMEQRQQQPAPGYNAYGGYAAAQPSASVQPGMRYRDYKDLYDPKAYIHQPGDRYIPAVGGLCSWVIPGLGQMICGEVGRGFGYLGGAIGCSVAMGVGSALMASGAYDYMDSDGEYGGGKEVTGTILLLAGTAALLTVDICAIVDGVRVAKIKNMYEQDMRRMSSMLDVKLQPYVSTVSNGISRTPVAGFSLAVNF